MTVEAVRVVEVSVEALALVLVEGMLAMDVAVVVVIV